MVVLDLKTIHKGNVIIVSRKLDTCILNTISFSCRWTYHNWIEADSVHYEYIEERMR